MNANVKPKLLLFFAMLAFVVLLFDCRDNALNPSETQTPNEMRALSLSDIRNFIWTLDRSGYEPFYLIYDEEKFFGDDGCNYFGGEYVARNDSVFPGNLLQSLRLCAGSFFSVQHLAQPYRVQIFKNELRLFTQEVMITYKSEVTDSVANSLLLGNWKLTASTDPDFDEIRRQQLLPTLHVDGERGFEMDWRCSPDNIFGCDRITGIFGIGATDKVLFYKRGVSAHGTFGPDFMNKILEASTYSVAADTLTLFNQKARAKYIFTAIAAR